MRSDKAMSAPQKPLSMEKVLPRLTLDLKSRDFPRGVEQPVMESPLMQTTRPQSFNFTGFHVCREKVYFQTLGLRQVAAQDCCERHNPFTLMSHMHVPATLVQ